VTFINALNVMCAQLTRDLFAIAKFLLYSTIVMHVPRYNILDVKYRRNIRKSRRETTLWHNIKTNPYYYYYDYYYYYYY